MENIVFTQLSIPELRKVFRQEMRQELEFIFQYLKRKESQKNGIEYLTKKEAAQIANVATSTIDNWRREGKIPIYRFGSAIRFKKSELLEFLESKRVR